MVSSLMRSYQLRMLEQEEGPYSEEQIARLSSDGRVNRYTPWRPIGARERETATPAPGDNLCISGNFTLLQPG